MWFAVWKKYNFCRHDFSRWSVVSFQLFVGISWSSRGPSLYWLIVTAAIWSHTAILPIILALTRLSWDCQDKVDRPPSKASHSQFLQIGSDVQFRNRNLIHLAKLSASCPTSICVIFPKTRVVVDRGEQVLERRLAGLACSYQHLLQCSCKPFPCLKCTNQVCIYLV